MHRATSVRIAALCDGMRPEAVICCRAIAAASGNLNRNQMPMPTNKPGTISQWENIARKLLVVPDKEVSRSEVDSVLIGITRSKDRWLKERLQEKRLRAWTASITKR